MSPTTPPPSATTQASRLRRRSTSASSTRSTVASVLCCSPSGRITDATRLPARPRSSRARYSGATISLLTTSTSRATIAAPSRVGVVEQPRPDEDRVAALAELDGQALHQPLRASARRRAISSTTEPTLRPSVSTVEVRGLLVERRAHLHQALERAVRVGVAQQGPMAAAPGACELLVHRGPKIHDAAATAEPGAVVGVEHGATAGRHQHCAAARSAHRARRARARGSPPRLPSRRRTGCRRRCGPRSRRRCR